MRILEHFFPNRELNLQSLRSISRDISNGTFDNRVPQHSPDSEEQKLDGSESDGEKLSKDTEPVVESLTALHDPLGCLMQDSMGKYRMALRF